MNKTGFGFLRLPRTEDDGIDYSVLNPMVDHFLELGGTYFDTAYTYLDGSSEEAIRKAVVERHPRSSFVIADKLPGYIVKDYDECRTYFEESLRRCGVDYFDVFLLHWLNEKNYALAEKHDEFRFLRELKAAGKAKRIGFSYHDGPELLDCILVQHPEVDIVQLQINYLDWNSVSIQAKKCYDVAVKHGKSIVIMEPVKGGSLASLPQAAEEILRNLRPEESIASWAIRFATDLEKVEVVLSGMNTMEQMEDNMRALPPLTDSEREALEQCTGIIRSNTAVPCTGCNYCGPNCPMHISIPKYFALYNDYARYPGDDWKMQNVYDSLVQIGGKPSDCISCKQCELNCPQKIGVTAFLYKLTKVFEK